MSIFTATRCERDEEIIAPLYELQADELMIYDSLEWTNGSLGAI